MAIQALALPVAKKAFRHYRKRARTRRRLDKVASSRSAAAGGGAHGGGGGGGSPRGLATAAARTALFGKKKENPGAALLCHACEKKLRKGAGEGERLKATSRLAFMQGRTAGAA